MNAYSTTEAAAWLGALELQDNRIDTAALHFSIALHGARSDEARISAERGLGDVALQRGRWTDAIAYFDEARRGAPPLLVVELQQKRAIATRERLRYGFAVASWLVLVLSVSWLAWRIDTSALRIPLETRFVAPVYLVMLVLGARGDPLVERAIAYIAVGSTLLITLGFCSVVPRATRSTLLVLSTCAVIFIALRHARLLDLLRETLQMSWFGRVFLV